MIFGKSKLEMRVGMFVFAGMVVLMIFVLYIGDFKNTLSTYRVNFTFNFINGVKVGSPVRFAGVDVGEIKAIEFFFPVKGERPKVRMVSIITKSIKIPRDSTVWVNTLGILGEKYIEIMPGRDYSDVLKNGDTMVGNDPFAMHEFGELAKSLATKLDTTLTSINGVADSIKTLTLNLDDGVTRIKNGEGTVGKLLYEDELYNEMEALVVDLKSHPWKLFWKGKEKPAPKK
ncbi:MAG TPA: MlaD family protein [Candidatus Omnitrophota bacterium]|nr:MlaD family protein [Candidatus Omnitrophota bacterium]HQJ15314.1 MlaD family protein [Candidatus Omnitrophota bacterium]